MANKQTLRLSEKFSDNIVSIDSSNRAYIDDEYFKICVGEDIDSVDNKNFPVTVEGLQSDWVINSDEGMELLEKMLKSEKIELFDIQTVIFWVEYLYKHYRQMIFKRSLPLYICQLIFFYLTIFMKEYNVPENYDPTLDEYPRGTVIVAAISLFFSSVLIIE
jgi:hypothetical protein